MLNLLSFRKKKKSIFTTNFESLTKFFFLVGSLYKRFRSPGKMWRIRIPNLEDISIEQKGMTFDHDYNYSSPLFSSLLKKEERRKGEWKAKIVMPFWVICNFFTVRFSDLITTLTYILLDNFCTFFYYTHHKKRNSLISLLCHIWIEN